jgi:hypothetical protein
LTTARDGHSLAHMTAHRFALVAAVVGAFAIVSPARAQDGPVVTPKDGSGDAADDGVDDAAAPPEQDEALKGFVGTWKCTGTSSTEFGADVPTTLSIAVKKDLGNRWLTVHTELVAKAKGAKPIASSELWGWSRAKGGLVRSGATSLGGFLQSTSTGWVGERFAWSGESAQRGKTAKEKLAFEKKSEKEIAVELSLGTDELHVLFEGTCRR